MRRAVLDAPSRHRGTAGFLLVEALATMAIGAVILVGLSTLVGLMLRTADKAAAQAQGLEQTDRTVAALTREIQALTRARWSGAEPRSFIFVGEPDRIMFARSASKAGASRAGAVPSTAVVTIQGSGANAGGRLLYAEAPLAPGSASLADLRFGPVRDLHEGAIAVRFAYFGRAGDAGGEVLVDAWPLSAALPTAVRIGIVDPATGSLLRSLRVPVLIEAEPGCAAPETAFCSRADPKKRAQAAVPPARSGQR